MHGTLLPIANYRWVLTTPSGAKYSGTIITDVDGFFIFNEPVEGMFNPYAGIFTLEILTEEDICTPASWNDSAYCEPYSCIEFEVKNGDYSDKNTIGCPCELL